MVNEKKFVPEGLSPFKYRYEKVKFPSTLWSYKWSLSTSFSTKILYVLLLSSIRATCPAHLILNDLYSRMIFGEKCRAWYSCFFFLYSPVTSSLSGPDIFLSTLFSDSISLCSSLSVRHQTSRPCKTTGKIAFTCVWSLCIWTANWKGNDSTTNIPWLQYALNFFMNESFNCQVWCKYLAVSPFETICYLSLCLSFSCILVSRHDHIRNFPSILFYTSRLTSDYQNVCTFLYSVFVSTQYISVIILNKKLNHTI
jgi:hypothetical protein